MVDTSALVAILRGEEDAERFLRILICERPVLLSAVSLLEASMLLCGPGEDPKTAWQDLDALLVRLGAEIVAHDPGLTVMARDAFHRFGKGRHPAALNFGDCASYALAKARGLPLLFRGGDFSKTDLAPA